MLSGACLCETMMLFWVAASVFLKCPEGLLVHLYAVAVLLRVVRGCLEWLLFTVRSKPI